MFSDLTLFNAVPEPADHELSQLMARIWTQFTKAGNPHGPGLPEWAPYDADAENYMEIGLDTGQKSELRIAQMDLIERAWSQRRVEAKATQLPAARQWPARRHQHSCSPDIGLQ